VRPPRQRQQFQHECCELLVEACEVPLDEGGGHDLHEEVQRLHAALAQQPHAHLRVDAAEGAALGQGCVDLLPDEGVAEVVVAVFFIFLFFYIFFRGNRQV
jgi:hypothetical protein